MKNNFDETVNISYVDDKLDKPTNIQIWKHFFSSVLVYFAIYIILKFNPFFSKQLNSQMLACYACFVILYVFLAPVFLYTIKPKSIHNSHAMAVTSYVTHLFKSMRIECFNNFQSLVDYLRPSYHQQQAFALYFVKVFFGTLMWAGVYSNIHTLILRAPEYASFFTSIYTQNISFFDFIRNNSNFIFFNLILLLFTIDLLVFAFGYITELDCLKNKIRSIDTSFAGIFFCLCCYPPFNNVTANFFEWNANEANCVLGDERSILTLLLRVFAIFCLVIYVAATIALGTRASNLTNRGTVSAFPYNIIRHPAYISKNLFWLSSTVSVLILPSDINLGHKILILISIIAWAGIYYMRALTEERHLLKDPEYQEYVKKVKYRFIPYIY